MSIIPQLEAVSVLTLFFLSFIINLYITGVFALAGFALPTQKILPKSYYTVTHSRKLKRIFKRMRVEWFREFLLRTFWKNAKKQANYFDGTKKGLANLETQSMKSEFGHLLPFIVINFVVVYSIFLGQIVLAAFILFFNIFGNLYPIILQRHHRMRIQIIRRRQQKS